MKGGLLLAQNCTDRKMMAFNRDGSVAYEWVPKDQTLRNMLRVPVPCTVDDDQCVRLWVRWDRSLRFAPDGECEMTSWIERHVMVLPDGGSTWGIRLGQVDLVRAGATTEILKRPDGTWFDGIQAAAIGADGAIAVAEEVDGCIVSVYSASGSPVAMHRFPSGSSYGYVVPGSGWVAVGGFRGWFVVRHSDGVVRRLHHGPASAAATESGDGLIVVDSNLVLTEYRITG